MYNKSSQTEIFNWIDIMKRDMDIIRHILFEIEKSDDPKFMEFHIKDCSLNQLNYHLKLLHQAKLIDAEYSVRLSGISWIIEGLTWAGHEFLDASRNDRFWEKAKNLLSDNLGSVTFKMLEQILIDLSKKQLGL